MGLWWMAKIAHSASEAKVLRKSAQHIERLEERQVLLEGLIELLIQDGDRAIYVKGINHTKAWREVKALAVKAAPDGDYALLLTSDMRVYTEPMAREYDDPVVIPVTNSPGFPGTVSGRLSSSSPNFKELPPREDEKKP